MATQMITQEMEVCAELCHECARLCQQCTVECVEVGDKSLARCIRLCLDCADICDLTANYLIRGSEHYQALARLCAEICEACAEECEKGEMDTMKRCAERSEEHTSELQSRGHLVCRLLLEKK